MAVKSSHVYKQLEEAERKGDLKKQFDILKNMLVTHQHLDIAQLKSSLARASVIAINSLPPVTTCIIDQQSYAIQFLQNDKVIDTLSLPKPENLQDFNSIDWIQAGQVATTVLTVKQAVATDTPTLEVLINSTYSKESKYGIKLAEEYPVLNIKELDKLLATAYLESYLWGFATQQQYNSYPLEMTDSYKSDKMAVSDRGAGLVYLIDLTEKKLLNTFKVRESGHNKRINLAFSTDSQFLYATDNQTNQVNCFNTATGENQVYQLEVPVCGNIFYSRQQNSVFLLAIDPGTKTMELLQCNPEENFAIINRVALTGEPFSLGYDPGDLMTMAPGGKHLIVMASTDQPMMYTPFLSLVDVDEATVINTLTLKIDQKPMNIAIRGQQTYPPNSSVKDILLGESLIDKKTFSMAMGIEEEEIVILNPVYRDEEVTSSEGLKASESGSAGNNGEGSGEVGGDTGAQADDGMAAFGGGGGGAAAQQRKADPDFQKLNSVKVEKYIYEYCVEQFAKKTKIELNEDEYATACDRLRTACSKARNDLVYQSETQVKITFFVNEHDLEVDLSRDQVSGALQSEEIKPKQSFQAVCQECGKPLPPNGGDCLTCHPPEQKETKEEEELKFAIAKQEGVDLDQKMRDLKGDIILTEAEKLKMLEDKMLADKKVGPLSREDMMAKMKTSNFGQNKNNGEPDTQEENGENSDVESGDPQTFVITDLTRKQVIEIDRDKKVKWKFGGYGSPAEEKAVHPLRAEKTKDHTILIVDSINKRVVEVSSDNSIICNWSNHLTSPQSAVKLENGNILVSDKGKVMELDKSDNLVRSFENGLNEPSYAFETKEKNIVIVDRGNNSITEISPDSEQLWHFEGLNKPEQVKKLDNGNFLIADTAGHRAIEVSPEKKIVWEFNGKPKGGMRILYNLPTQVFRLMSGNTLVIHTNERKTIELDNENNIVWQNLGSNFTQAI
jgi:DNA-binding beta-propeller fold protein YncE